jgi:hypothetical protein
MWTSDWGLTLRSSRPLTAPAIADARRQRNNMKPRYIFSALMVVALIFALSLYRFASPVATTLAGALASIKEVEEWVKWLTQIQVAALAVLLYVALDKDTLTTRAMTPSVQIFTATGMASLGFSIFLSSWLLSSLPSQLVRLHSMAATSPPSTQFDVYEMPAFGWLHWPTLGNFMSTVHWLWACGLLCLGATVLGLLLNRQKLAAASPPSTATPSKGALPKEK